MDKQEKGVEHEHQSPAEKRLDRSSFLLCYLSPLHVFFYSLSVATSLLGANRDADRFTLWVKQYILLLCQAAQQYN